MSEAASKKVRMYLVLTVILAAPFYYLSISAGTLSAGGGLYVLGLMWSPGVSALLTRLLLQRNVRGMGWGWGKARYQVASYLIPLVAGMGVYGFAWSVGIGGFSTEAISEGLPDSIPLAIGLIGTLGFLQTAIPSPGEEIGWRGLLVPELARITSYAKVSLITAAIWSIYHYPVLIFADYSSAAPRWYAFLMFTVSIVGVSFIATWLRLRSGSVWTGVILHTSHNLFVQGVFDGLTVEAGYTEYFTTEFGAGLAMVYVAGGWWCWRHRASLPDPVPASTADTSAE